MQKFRMKLLFVVVFTLSTSLPAYATEVTLVCEWFTSDGKEINDAASKRPWFFKFDINTNTVYGHKAKGHGVEDADHISAWISDEEIGYTKSVKFKDNSALFAYRVNRINGNLTRTIDGADPWGGENGPGHFLVGKCSTAQQAF